MELLISKPLPTMIPPRLLVVAATDDVLTAVNNPDPSIVKPLPTLIQPKLASVAIGKVFVSELRSFLVNV